ncbi:TolC family outer membrane protein [Thiohalorhabdus methylotrophus]|uniref:TolC family outer membrane protein n=1 Tax=Thiohalorhabdus methylotrophus TaxID=3242694 RepID=A0ABV4TX25_9GAMM
MGNVSGKARTRGLLLGMAAVLAAPPVQAADLLDLYRTAEQVSPNLEQAQRQRLIANYQEDQAQAGFFPSLTGQASRSWNEETQVIAGSPQSSGTTDYTQDQYSLTLSQPLFMGGRTWLSVDIAQLGQRQAEAQLSATRQDLMVQVAEAYFAVLNAQDDVNLAQREVRRVKEHLERAQAQFDVGTGDITGVREAQARRDQAQTRLIRARNTLQTARQRLRRLIRKRPPALEEVEEVELGAPDPSSPEAWVDRALGEHPELVRLRKQLNIDRKNVDLARRQRWPEISAQAQYSKVEGGSFFTSDEVHSATLQMDWPIYQGGRVSATTNIRQEQASQTRLQLDDQQEQVRVQTTQAFYDWESAMQEVRSLRAQVRSAKTQLEAIQTGFEVGRRTSIDVLDAQQEYFDALRNLSQARNQYLLSRLQLKSAAGVLTMADLQTVNRQLN